MTTAASKRSVASGGISLPFSPKHMGLLASETMLAFVNFSLLVEYISIIWFYPMGFMGFTGMEAFLVMCFTPLLLGIRPLNQLLSNGRLLVAVRLVAQIMSLAALYPYDIDPNYAEKNDLVLWKNPHVTKTVFVGLGFAFDWMCQCRQFTSNTTVQRRERTTFAYMLAIVFHAIIRMPYHSINPFMTWKSWIVFGIILVVVSGFALINDLVSSDDAHERRRPVLEDSESPLTTGVSFGGLVFMGQLFLSSYGVVPRWVNFGPFPSGILVVLFMVIGIVISKKTALVNSRGYFFFSLAMATLYGFCSGTVPTAIGLVGLVSGCLVVCYAMSLWYNTIEKMSNTSAPLALFSYAFITYTVLLFWAIYVVSYKFVPWYLGSTLLRERHQTMVIAAVIACGIGALNQDTFPHKKESRQQTVSFPSREVFYAIFTLLGLLVLISINRNAFHPSQSNVAAVHYDKITTADGDMEYVPPTEIKSMIWTIHFGYDNYGRNSFPNITEAIKSHGVNVIGLLESDLSRIMTSNRDLVEYVANELKMHSDFGPAPSENTWGCALLSAFPIERSRHVILPSPEGELACLIDAVIKVDDVEVNVIVTHFGNTEDVLDRKLQAQGAADIITKNDMPTVFLSYITEKTGGDNYKTLRSTGLEDTTTERRYCEYVFYKGLEMTEFKRWPCGEISDTEGQLTTFRTKK
ncbi:hypothetical protein SAMD00019534_035200 [Acytostelium subglobosum LB1]|uniref:hypothetical protein n=1 Tax=Acytostelium subglobosum LB1 TaxID=1410327 RepID=UPI000644E59F|nr:hypothetical protein SAMD00019534_035200 [Acytostelium subglobosum LB1]GAM20345.1 hypothetical protein SAMD00019534_035200 [Acytostelium subglobosum LB1]|eukprot:XP_012759866.1 hypothetical protein SAMD00019534_035200 [Acytostelium subglobosum LB1]